MYFLKRHVAKSDCGKARGLQEDSVFSERFITTWCRPPSICLLPSHINWRRRRGRGALCNVGMSISSAQALPGRASPFRDD